MLGRKLILLLFLIVCGVSSVSAQSKYEVTPFFGARFGGSIQVNGPFVDYLPIRSSEDFGVQFGYNLWDNFQPEFMWNRQPTTINAHNPGPPSTITPLGRLDIDMYQFSILYEFRSSEAKLKPYLVAGLGWTHFGNGDNLMGFSNKFSYNLGGGLKYYFTQLFGLRLDVRYSPTRTTPSQSIQNGFLVNTYNHAKQGQADLGLIFRF
jgi:opacity protein-like surface antigen